MSAKFGPAGNSDAFSAVHKSSLAAPQWIAEQGLDCYEYQCGKGVHVGEDTARRVGENARKHGISLSLHAPYFINLANPDPDSLQKTIGYITSACLVASQMGASRVVIHSGALMKRTRREALDTALRSLREVIRTCDGQGFGHIALCPETMGKINQLGDLEEVLELFQDRTPLIIELKAERGNHAALAEATCRMLDRYRVHYCIESFDPRCLIWLKKNRPEIVRGQLSEQFLRHGETAGHGKATMWLLGNLFSNVAVRPDFIAYRFSDRDNLCLRWCRKFYHVQEVNWTIRTKEEMEAAEAQGNLVIFECFDPKG